MPSGQSIIRQVNFYFILIKKFDEIYNYDVHDEVYNVMCTFN